MSNAIFPTLIGLTYPFKKTPTWNTITQKSVSARQVRVALQAYPTYDWQLSYDMLRGDANAEFQTLLGFFNQRQGAYDSFLLLDPDDNAITSASIGLGDGTTTGFQLLRPYGGFIEPVYDLAAAPSIYVNGVLKVAGTDYSVSATGFVTFTAAPAAATALTWSGSYYWRVHFKDDSVEFDKLSYQFWELNRIDLESVKL